MTSFHRIVAAAFMPLLWLFLCLWNPARALCAEPPADSGRDDGTGDFAWGRSFTGAGAAAMVGDNPGVVMVAIAGGEGGDVKTAGDAFRAGVRDAARARLVLDSTPLGAVFGLSDFEIVSRAAALRCDTVVVVRPGPRDASTSVSVAIYSGSGIPIGRWGAVRGNAPVAAASLVAPVAPGDAGPDSTRVSAPAPAAPAAPATKSVISAGGMPTQVRLVVLSHMVSFGKPGAAGTIDKKEPWLGQENGKALEGAGFYAAVDRPDLAASYARGALTKTALFWTGLPAMGAGLVAISYAYSLLNYSYDGSTNSARDTIYGVGGAVIVLGAAALITSLALPKPHPVSTDEAVDLVRQHNEAARKKYGTFEEDPALTERTTAPPFSWTLAPIIAPSAGGLQLSATF